MTCGASRSRVAMREPYRTLLGHFRHEVGHYFWDRLVRDAEARAFRALFGDKRADYGQALQRHYEQGPPADWQSRFVSAYPQCIRGRTSPRPGRTTCTSSPALETPGPFALSTWRSND